jgi:hypothetical protein
MVLACVAVTALAVLAGLLVSAWALLVLPVAAVGGLCALWGMSLAQTARAFDDGGDADPGRGPAG